MEEVPVTLAASWVAWIAATAAVGIAIAFALSETYRRRQLERAGDAIQLQRMTASLSMRRRVLKAALIAVALPLALLALARPQVESEATWTRRGIDVAIVMDYSIPMLARDVYPSRARRMEREVEDLLARLEADRVALVPFAGAAAHVPLTHDHEAAAHVFRGLSPRDMPPGSDLGEGLRVARCLLRPDRVDAPGCERLGGRGRGGELEPAAVAEEPPDRGRAIVVYTDGEDTGGRAREEVERALELGIEVYLVGVGTTAGELIPEPDARGGEAWMRAPDGESFVVARLRAGALRELAQLAGGDPHYIALDPARPGAREVLERLRRLRQGDMGETTTLQRPREAYAWFLIPALLLFALEASIGERRRDRRRRRREEVEA